MNDRPAPGSVSHLAPAQFLFGIHTNEDIPRIAEPFGGIDRRGLYFLQLDNRDIAEWSPSELIENAFTSKEKCADMPDSCRKTTRITARPDSNEISMEVDIETGRSMVRQVFVLRRKSVSGQ